MKKILVVEDSRIFRDLIKKRIVDQCGYECLVACDFQEAKSILASPSDEFLMAILDLNLPDAPDGEIVEYVISKNIPTIVITALINDEIRNQIMSQGIIDYIFKEGPQSLDQLMDSIRRYIRNQDISVLVVDDSSVSRSLTRRMLEKRNYNVLEAESGNEALTLLKNNPGIQLVVTDYNMPNMSGSEFTVEIRKKIPMEEMAVIGMSAVGNPLLSAQFLKSGANDFVNKPYYEEEFLWRINQNIEMIQNIKKIKSAAIKDHLTGLYNRRYFFGTAKNLYENAKRKNIYISIGLMDIDYFKAINDTYGHAAGDEVLQYLSKILSSSLRASDIVARYGGEEFIVLTTNNSERNDTIVFERIRKRIEKSPAETSAGAIQVTISIGVTTQLRPSLEEMIKEADDFLYQAKESGRNRIVGQSEP